MRDIVKRINTIEELYTSKARGKRCQALKEIYLLCKDIKSCKEFYQRALNIFREYNELEEKNDYGTIELSQYEIEKRKNCLRFEELLVEIKNKFNISQLSLYEKQELIMKKQKNIMKESFVNIEEILIDGGSPVKIKMLKIIKEQLRKMRVCFPDLIVIFESVKEYE
ncbi:MAG: hypothetical protein D3925_01635 [Candidatus Electrothrix sp. AR5]|nr:hypothetical protein [Candidatus Electrothrix sp. AR5]